MDEKYSKAYFLTTSIQLVSSSLIVNDSQIIETIHSINIFLLV